MPVVNVGQRMREEAYLTNGKKFEHFNVSKKAVEEYISRIHCAFEVNMHKLCEIAKADGNKTILERHVIALFSLANTSVVKED